LLFLLLAQCNISLHKQIAPGKENFAGQTQTGEIATSVSRSPYRAGIYITTAQLPQMKVARIK